MADLDRFQIVRPLGADVSSLLARDVSAVPPRPVVLDRLVRAAGEEAFTRLVRRARALVALEHPKVVPVREVVEREGEVFVVSEFIDGEWLSALLALDPRPPLQVLMRLILDVLEGLAALHDLPNEHGQPMRIVHGSLSPDSVLVAEDGVAEVARPCVGSAQRPERFVAPEVRRGEMAVDVRADIYSVGAMLRDALAGASSDAKWAEGLTDIASRACSFEPTDRFPSAAAMATAVRRIAGPRLAPVGDVATLVKKQFGVRIRARRASVAPLEDSGPPSSGQPISVRPSDLLVIDPPSETQITAAPVMPKPSTAPVARPTPPPPPVRSPASRTAPPVRPGEGGEDAASRRSGMVAAIAAPLPPPRPRQSTLPPPDIVVPDVPDEPPPAAAPPPPRRSAAPARGGAPEPVEAYRRQLPTFPTSIEAPAPRSPFVAIAAIGAVVVTSFTAGWFVGKENGTATAQLACAASAMQAMAMAQRASQEDRSTPTAAATPAPTSTPTAAPEAGATTDGGAASDAGTDARTASPATVTTTSTAASTPTFPATATPASVMTNAAPHASAKPGASAAAAETAKPPAPAATSGYVPGEL